MARVPRQDEPGRWFHVMNRGIAKRTVFEGRADVRYFLSRIARAVRRRDLELHVYCLMATHYHLLVRSPSGRLSEGMRRVQNEYVRYFNRSRRRDGPLFRGRFMSRLVDSVIYQEILVRYIDNNPVKAKVVERASEYPYGSARAYVLEDLPPWLDAAWVMRYVADAQRYDAGASYSSVWGGRISDAEWGLVQARSDRSQPGRDALDDLVRSTPDQVRSLMLRKAKLADATRAGIVLVQDRWVLQVIDRERFSSEGWTYEMGRGGPRSAWDVVAAGLLRELSALSYEGIAARLECSLTAARKRVQRHRGLLRDQQAYAVRASELVRSVMDYAYGASRTGVRIRS